MKGWSTTPLRQIKISPSATAILTVLYPATFTMYDIRVCDALDDLGHRGFSKLGDKKWSVELWADYQRFVAAVRAAAPADLSLRDCDRWLWGQAKRKDMEKEWQGGAPAHGS